MEMFHTVGANGQWCYPDTGKFMDRLIELGEIHVKIVLNDNKIHLLLRLCNVSLVWQVPRRYLLNVEEVVTQLL